MKAFNAKAFDKAFNAAIIQLTDAEKITKAVLSALSRDVLQALHATEDIGYVNRLIACLTPMNKATAVFYFKAFGGFSFNSDDGLFGKKDKAHYAAKAAESAVFLEDPLNNIWTWASRNVEVEAKAYDAEALQKSLEATLKKADKAGFSQADVITSMLRAGLKVDTLLAIMDELQAEGAAPAGQELIGGA